MKIRKNYKYIHTCMCLKYPGRYMSKLMKVVAGTGGGRTRNGGKVM